MAAYPAEPSDQELADRARTGVETVVRADMNTLGGAPLAGVGGSLASVHPRAIVEYGDLAYLRLRAELADRLDVAPERVVPGAGADELIRLVTTQAVGAGDAVVVPTPTFAMFAVEALLAGARVVDVPRTDPACRQTPTELRAAVTDQAARLAWLCNPNNPTGDAYTLAEVRELADALPSLVCVDEVYAEFGEDSVGAEPGSTSAVRLQHDLPNVLVLRSLSKAYGMAGARVGYLVVPDPLVDRFQAARLPLSVAAPSEAIALAALADEAATRDRRRQLIDARRRLARDLEELGCRVLASVTNFVTFRPPDGRDAAAIDAAMLDRGVALRRYETGPIAGWLRATARLDHEEDRLLTALREVLA